MSDATVEKIFFIGNSFVSKRKTNSGSEMNSSSSTKNCILQSLNYPLFLIKDFNSLVKNISKKQQKHYYSFYNQFCQQQIEQLRETLQDEKVLNKSESTFLQLVEQFVKFPDLLQVPRSKYFEACLEDFFNLVVSVVLILKKEVRSLNNLIPIPGTMTLIELVLCKVIPLHTFNENIRYEISNVINEFRSRSFKKIFNFIIQVLMDFRRTILEKLITKNNNLVHRNQVVSSISQAIQSVFEKAVLFEAINTECLTQCSMAEKEQLPRRIEETEGPPAIHITTTKLTVDPRSIPTDVDTFQIQHPTSFDFLFFFVFSTSTSYFLRPENPKNNSKSFCLSTFYNYSSRSCKLRWLELLSHRPKVVACDVVSAI
jgi:hypothetical protein